jgi:hypothetical protein
MNDMMQIEEWVVFMDVPQKPSLRLLKQGFRHCAYVRREKNQWVVYDPLSYHTEMALSSDSTLMTRFEQAGFICVKVKYKAKIGQKIIWPEFISCVTQIKRILNVQNIWVQTPYQLYKFLQRNTA